MNEKKENKRLNCYFGDSNEDKKTWERYQRTITYLNDNLGMRITESAFLKRLISLGLDSYNKLQGGSDE